MNKKRMQIVDNRAIYLLEAIRDMDKHPENHEKEEHTFASHILITMELLGIIEIERTSDSVNIKKL